ncbi:TetR/AcrR family transcriptional regulator [Caulobacter mirabilis]|uniref:TetR family transcriptional regulator n=1 Tax=Caulobacter mirabilis TaxID=69666 RepID=A0A2D2AZE6_9CAUL|nr:TetR/AcrR family transcriptional regulator [Caulobacter mirabilis]ATQ43362.1 TetR family transcriptional regulator [Caulobacter mirabilis]
MKSVDDLKDDFPAKKASPRKAQVDRRRESMESILDHAEALFAESGFNGVTINDVARSASVDTGLIRYYFGDKSNLFEAVVDRRSGVANEARLKALNEYRRTAGASFSLEGVIRAFTAPAFDLMLNDEGYRNYGMIIGYVNATHADLRRLMSKNFDHVSEVLIEDMKRLLPDANLEDLYWGYHFLTGAFTFSLAQTGRIDSLSGDMCKSEDLQAISERLPITLAAGIRAMCDERAAARKRAATSTNT